MSLRSSIALSIESWTASDVPHCEIIDFEASSGDSNSLAETAQTAQNEGEAASRAALLGSSWDRDLEHSKSQKDSKILYLENSARLALLLTKKLMAASRTKQDVFFNPEDIQIIIGQELENVAVTATPGVAPAVETNRCAKAHSNRLKSSTIVINHDFVDDEYHNEAVLDNSGNDCGSNSSSKDFDHELDLNFITDHPSNLSIGSIISATDNSNVIVDSPYVLDTHLINDANNNSIHDLQTNDSNFYKAEQEYNSDYQEGKENNSKDSFSAFDDGCLDPINKGQLFDSISSLEDNMEGNISFSNLTIGQENEISCQDRPKNQQKNNHKKNSQTGNNGKYLLLDIKFMHSQKNNDKKTTNNYDQEMLHQMGVIFYKLFSKRNIPAEILSQLRQPTAHLNNSLHSTKQQQEDTHKRSRRFSNQQLVLYQIRDHTALSLSLCRFIVNSFMEQSTPNNTLQKLIDVHSDLLEMCKHPHIFLHGVPPSTPSQMNLGAEFYGRKMELNHLQEAASRVKNRSSKFHPTKYAQKILSRSGKHSLSLESLSSSSSSLSSTSLSKNTIETVFVKGRSGSGKSRLLKHFGSILSKDNSGSSFIWLDYKFDQMNQLSSSSSSSSESFSAIVSICQSYCHKLLEMREGEAHDLGYCDAVRKEVMNSIGHEGLTYLAECIPTMKLLFDFDSDTQVDTEDGLNLQNKREKNRSSFSISGNTPKWSRQIALLSVFFCTILTMGRPILLFFDDLQFANEAKLKPIGNFVTSISSHQEAWMHLLFVGSYREEEVNETHQLFEFIRFVGSTGAIRTSYICVGSFTPHHLNEIVSSKLFLPSRITASLTEIVFAKTAGNILFVMQFLKALMDKEILKFNLCNHRWEWDEDIVAVVGIKDNVADFLVDKLNTLTNEQLGILKVISCFGSHVELLLLEELDGVGGIREVSATLNFVKQEGFIEKSLSSVMFSHDTVQKCVYGLIPEEQKGIIHSAIGEKLIQSRNLDAFLVEAVSQINWKTQESVTDPKERIKLASLNLRAGKKVMQSSEFATALIFMEVGISFLNKCHWAENYKLSFALFKEAAKLSLIQGKGHATVSKYANEVMHHSRNFEDTETASLILIKSQASSGQKTEAIACGLRILIGSLGLSFPAEPKPHDVLQSINEVNDLLGGATPDFLQQLPAMTDKRKLYAMKVIDAILLTCFQAVPLLVPLLSCTGIKLTLEYGHCDESIGMLMFFAFANLTFLENYEESYRLGKMALSLLRTWNSECQTAHVYNIMYSGISFWFEPLQSTAAQLANAYDRGLSVGDVDSSMNVAKNTCKEGYYCGTNLSKLCHALESYLRMMKIYNIIHSLNLTVIDYLFISELSGRNFDPFSLLGEDINNSDQLLKVAIESNDKMLAQQIFFQRLSSAFWFRNYEAFVRLSFDFERVKSKKAKLLSHVFHVFWGGIVAFYFNRETLKDAWLLRGEKAVDQMRSWEKLSTWNFENKLLLLEAECYFAKNKFEDARLAYAASIESAKRHRFIHEEALASEQFGMFLLGVGDLQNSISWLKKARDLYAHWGADLKAQSLEPFLFVNTIPSH